MLVFDWMTSLRSLRSLRSLLDSLNNSGALFKKECHNYTPGTISIP